MALATISPARDSVLVPLNHRTDDGNTSVRQDKLPKSFRCTCVFSPPRVVGLINQSRGCGR